MYLYGVGCTCHAWFTAPWRQPTPKPQNPSNQTKRKRHIEVGRGTITRYPRRLHVWASGRALAGIVFRSFHHHPPWLTTARPSVSTYARRRGPSPHEPWYTQYRLPPSSLHQYSPLSRRLRSRYVPWPSLHKARETLFDRAVDGMCQTPGPCAIPFLFLFFWEPPAPDPKNPKYLECAAIKPLDITNACRNPQINLSAALERSRASKHPMA